jgi:transcriptional regulator with XRE-family HTH domain
MKGYGKGLRNARRKSGITQRELAKKIGVSFTYISKIENERVKPNHLSEDVIRAYARAVGMPEDMALELVGKINYANLQAVAESDVIAAAVITQMSSGKLDRQSWRMLFAVLSSENARLFGSDE